MRAFAAAWSEQQFVQEALARIPWYQQIALLEKVSGAAEPRSAVRWLPANDA
jgi:hypothetical protein